MPIRSPKLSNPAAGWLKSFVTQFSGESDDPDGAKHIAWFLKTFAVVLLITASAGLIIAVGSIDASPGHLAATLLAGVNFVGLGLLISCAAFAAGGVLGFLFGIPRVGAVAETGGATASPINSNTNLEQVSDWVTKIVVGLGLTQAYQVNALLVEFSYTVQQGLAPVKDAGLAACLILLGSSVAGFITAYLKARTALVLAFAAATNTVQQALSDLALEHMFDEATKVLNGRGVTADQTARDVATRLLRSAPDKTSSPLLLKQIGMAYATTNNFAAAAAALGLSAKNDPSDTTTKFLAVRAATLAGRTQDAAQMADNTPPPAGQLNDQEIENSLAAMFAGLYNRGAYPNVIAIGERLAEDATAKTKSRLWLYLAAAYGQAYTAALALARPPGAVTPDMKTLRDKALDAATRAKILDGPKNLPILQQLWDPNAPGKTPGEDDLEGFIDDPDFQALLGPATPAPPAPPPPPPPPPPQPSAPQDTGTPAPDPQDPALSSD
jgi:hypothetical protein